MYDLRQRRGWLWRKFLFRSAEKIYIFGTGFSYFQIIIFYDVIFIIISTTDSMVMIILSHTGVVYFFTQTENTKCRRSVIWPF